ncbi:LysM peptidoglycan-binding domain-containing protein [Spongiivirga citrea]|uniref:LysM peptidoglycan-binding domain-containing protein n=1 Tax=Spongiivirga citrea TaxID=1481457 RepID=A0A6M0CLT5_9FLAO|nr:LysM peptidoglycan-binding domain-containing protein [Spongiivirga citrea]NER18895.1 LysM peptidoglycan-binding domain-containing protein [Spongiivirga citrea]
MKYLCYVLTLLSCSLSLGQQDSIPTKPETIKIESSVDSLLQNKEKLEVLTIDKKVITTKSIAGFRDYEKAYQYDSLWLQLQRESDYYQLVDVISKDENSVVNPNLPTDTLKHRLALLNERTPFNVEYNPGLERVINTFLTKKSDFLQRMLTKSQFYFPMFEQQLDNYDIPLEMKYLAIVESALNPRARSRVGATGLWQFMYPTGRQFGLDVNSYVDERRDPIMATEAACKYLKALNKTFDDWDLALAAYNSGPGNVSRAIRRSGGRTNYWNLRGYLPRETAGYVPAFLAMMYIFEYADVHGIQPQKLTTPYFETDTLHIKQLITFDQIEAVTDIPEEELQFFNPSYKLDIIPVVKGKNYYLRLPKHASGRFVANEDSIYSYAKAENAKREKPLPKLQELNKRIRYRVRNGDYLGKIANLYGVRIRDIKRWNGMRSNNLKIGQRLTIFPRKPGFAAVKPETRKKSKPIDPTNLTTYVVEEGDSLWTISQKFPGVSIQNIKDWNDISGSNLQPGMKLKISGGKP